MEIFLAELRECDDFINRIFKRAESLTRSKMSRKELSKIMFIDRKEELKVSLFKRICEGNGQYFTVRY